MMKDTLLLAADETRTFFEMVPLVPISTGLHFALAAIIVLILMSFIIWMYIRDGVELPRGITATLGWLRILAFAGLVLFFINPEKRSEKRVVKNSRLPILVDTSLSMGIRDRQGAQAETPSRMEQVRTLLAQPDLIEPLRQQHDVIIYRFDESNRPEELITLSKISSEADNAQTITQDATVQWNQLQSNARIGFVLASIGLLVSIISFVLRLMRPVPFMPWVTFTGVLLLTVGYAQVSYQHLQVPTVSPWSLLSADTPMDLADEAQTENDEDSTDVDAGTSDADVENWLEQLEPQGVATRLGEALRFLINKERGGPIAGVLLVSDGCKNAGADPDLAVAGAREAGIPIISLGVGSNQPLENVEVVDIRAPKRVFPTDKFQIRGLIQSSGMGGQSINVKLVSVDEQRTEAEQEEGEATVDLTLDGSPVAVDFEVARSEQGKRIYELRLVPPANDFDPSDNSRQAVVEVIERKSKILTIAGGPTREYRFLRNQLYRDDEVTSDVWLQTAPEGIAQEADNLLENFPTTREELFEYDCVVAFDPDWRALTPEQMQLLEEWVAEQAGGLIVVAGPVYTPEWTRRTRGDEGIDLIRRLYPVSFFSQNTGSIKVGRFGGEKPFPLALSREGKASEFLWLGDSAQEAEDNWGDFEGVYGYYAVNEPKPGAVIYANFSDPSTEFDGRLPIYLAGQFYGAGRVFFQASGEMWRVREVDVEFFEQYYTKLIRWASQGRLLRDSTQGVLLVDQERCWLGDQLTVQAILRDDQNQPLAAPQVTATVLLPDRTTLDITLTAMAEGARPGTFTGQITAAQEGDYRVSLLVPGSDKGDVLTAEFRADIPDLEKDKAERNDELLESVTQATSGQLITPIPANSSDAELQSALKIIQPRDQESYLPGTPDTDFTRALMGWLLGLVAGALCLEWLTRRLNRLA
jgi:hypothetical protein